MSEEYSWICERINCKHYAEERESWGPHVGHCTLTRPSTSGKIDYEFGLAVCHSFSYDPEKPDPAFKPQKKEEINEGTARQGEPDSSGSS